MNTKGIGVVEIMILGIVAGVLALAIIRALA